MYKDDENTKQHPSYALARFSRCQGNPGTLFGSALKSHESYITLSLSTAKHSVDQSGQNHYYGPIRGNIVEVVFSPAQFAELLTTMNMGSGVPCTLQYKEGKRVESPPEEKLETEKVRLQFEKDLKDISKRIQGEKAKAAQLLEKKSLTKGDKEALIKAFDWLITEISSNAPFMLELFEESAQKIVTASKAEIDAFVTHSIIAEGIKAMIAKGNDTPELPENAGTE